jgi:hypothetical protein
VGQRRDSMSRGVYFFLLSDESCRQNQNTYFMFNNFFPENPAVYELMWKNMVQPDRPQMTI